MQNVVSQFLDVGLDPFAIAVLVLLIDGLIGDPRWFYKRIPHPVALIGTLISRFESTFNQPSYSDVSRFILGAFTSVSVIAAATIAGMVLSLIGDQFPGGFLVVALISSSLVACRGLYDAVRLVQTELTCSLDTGRVAVSQIVGRDPESLDEAGVARAAIESLAENFSDGTVAPVFWFLLFGLPGLLFYKAINTLDSMIGHHNDRYEYFGKFAARLDDVVNFIPARITGLLIVGVAFVVPGTSGVHAFKALLCDARHHKSVNAGWQEAAMAGALDVSLAGPRLYKGTLVEDVWMNEGGRRDAGPSDIQRALMLYAVTAIALFLLLGLLAVVVLT